MGQWSEPLNKQIVDPLYAGQIGPENIAPMAAPINFTQLNLPEFTNNPRDLYAKISFRTLTFSLPFLFTDAAAPWISINLLKAFRTFTTAVWIDSIDLAITLNVTAGASFGGTVVLDVTVNPVDGDSPDVMGAGGVVGSPDGAGLLFFDNVATRLAISADIPAGGTGTLNERREKIFGHRGFYLERDSSLQFKVKKTSNVAPASDGNWVNAQVYYHVFQIG